MIALGLLPAVVALALWVGLAARAAAERRSWREASLQAAVLLGFGVAVLTAIGSFADALVPWVIRASWLVIGAVSAAWAAGAVRRAGVGWRWPRSARPQGVVEWTLLVVALALSAHTLLIAAVSVPNSWDAMGYHLPRVLHWLEHRNVAFFPTHDVRQIYQAPLAEYFLLHVQALAGSDRWAALLQGPFAVVAALGASLVARDLGAGRRGQVFAAAFAITVPVGVLQLTAVKNEWVVTAFLVTALHFLLAARAGQARALGWAVAAAGLAVATKATAAPYLLPLILWPGLAALRQVGRASGRPILLGVIMSVAINAPQAARNFAVFGSPLGSTTHASSPAARAFGPLITMSTALRNLTLHTATPSSQANRAIESVVRRAHALVGLDVDDPATTLGKFSVLSVSASEWGAGASVQALASIWVLTLLCSGTRRRREPDIARYAGVLLVAFLLFAVTVKHQRPNARLHLPLLVLGAVPITLALERMARPGVACVVVMFQLLVAPVFVARNAARPLAAMSGQSTRHQFFTLRPEIERDYAHAVGVVRQAARLARREGGAGVTRVGLQILEDDKSYEYPLWALLGALKHPSRFLFAHVGVVSNDSGRFEAEPPFAAFVPDLIFRMQPYNKRERPPERLILRGRTYKPLDRRPTLAVYALPAMAEAYARARGGPTSPDDTGAGPP